MRIGALLDRISAVGKWPALKKPGVKKMTQVPEPVRLPDDTPAEPVTPDIQPKVVHVSLAQVETQRSKEVEAEAAVPATAPIDLAALDEASETPPQTTDLGITANQTDSASTANSTQSATAPASPANPAPQPADAALTEGFPSEKKTGEEVGAGSEEDLFKQLFNKQEEKEETPLDRLVAALPEVSMQELFDQAETVRALMREWPQA